MMTFRCTPKVAQSLPLSRSAGFGTQDFTQGGVLSPVEGQLQTLRFLKQTEKHPPQSLDNHKLCATQHKVWRPFVGIFVQTHLHNPRPRPGIFHRDTNSTIYALLSGDGGDMRNAEDPPNRWRSAFLPIIKAMVLASSTAIGMLTHLPLQAQTAGEQSSTSQGVSGQSPTTPPGGHEPAPTGTLQKFEAISVKRSKRSDPRASIQVQPGGRFVMTNASLRPVIALAYNLSMNQARGGAMVSAPDWIDSERYDIEARAEGAPPKEQARDMVAALLADRFKLAVHWEAREMPLYALTIAKPGKTGPQLVAHAADNSTCQAAPPSLPPPGSVPARPLCGVGFLIGPGKIVAEITMENLAKSLSWFGQIDRAVVDETALSGTFDITLVYAPVPPGAGGPEGDQGSTDSSLPSSIFTALQEQLGLKLVPQKGPIQILVIDHIERPSEN
jgi:uncharacterized protein (TIGR03435 family)